MIADPSSRPGRSPAWLAGALVGSVLLASGPARAEEPPARYPATSARWKLVVGGVGLTAGAYGVGAACAAAWPEVPGSEALYIPVAGPWITLGQSGCADDDPGCGAILGVRGVLLVLSGLIQAGGLAVAGEGLFMTTESARTDATVDPGARPAAAVPRQERAAVELLPVPLITERQAGLGVVGSF